MVYDQVYQITFGMKMHEWVSSRHPSTIVVKLDSREEFESINAGWSAKFERMSGKKLSIHPSHAESGRIWRQALTNALLKTLET